MKHNKQYISVVNSSELYKINKALTGKEFFEIVPLETAAIANFNDSKKDILVQITEYDIIKNPSIIMKATKKDEILNKISARLENLDQTTRDTYLVLFTHWFKNKELEGMENEGNAYCEFTDIHFNYRGLTGKNKDSTLMSEQYNSYLQAVDILRNTRVKIDITKENNIVYDKIKNLGWTAMEGFLVNDVKLVYKNEKVIGIWYNMGILGEAYTEYIPQINNRYPTDLLKLDSKYSTVKNIGNYLCYLYSCRQDDNEVSSKINLFSLMGEVRYELAKGRYQQGINRFLNNLNKTKDLLISNKIIKDISVPEDIHSKNYKDKHIIIYWWMD